MSEVAMVVALAIFSLAVVAIAVESNDREVAKKALETLRVFLRK